MSDCIFCKIIEGTIPSAKLHEDENCIVFKDINPIYPVHLLIVPKKHIASVNEVAEGDAALLGALFTAARDAAKKMGVAENGYRLTVNTGAHAGQVVKHFHMHLLAGAPLNAL